MPSKYNCKVIISVTIDFTPMVEDDKKIATVLNKSKQEGYDAPHVKKVCIKQSQV